MKQTKLIMGMPVTLEILDQDVSEDIFQKVFNYFSSIDNKFSTYKKDSEISLYNQGKILKKDLSTDMKVIFKLAEKTKHETNGYFDIFHNRKIDPSGIVKGWAIKNAVDIIKKAGFKNFFLDVGGDIQVSGFNKKKKKWKVGIKNPFDQEKVVKVLHIFNKGVATSGTYIRGFHIYNPKIKDGIEPDIVSLTVIGPNIYEADRFATAGFAMGKKGIIFIESLLGFEGYLIDNKGVATMTSGLDRYL